MSGVDVDSYISSIKKIHFLIIVLTVLVSVVSFGIYTQQTLTDKLRVLDLVYAIKDYASDNKIKELDKMDRRWAPSITGDLDIVMLINDYILNDEDKTATTEGLSEEQKKRQEKIKWLLAGGLIEKSRVIPDGSFFSTPGKACPVAFFQGSSKESFAIFDNTITGRIYYTSYEDVYLVNFSTTCLSGMYGMKTALLIKSFTAECQKNKSCEPKWFIGIQPQDVSTLQIPTLGNDDLINTLKFDKLKHFADYDELDLFFIFNTSKYVYFPVDFYTHWVFSMASAKSNKFYGVDNLDHAFRDLFELGKKSSNFIGIEFDEILLLRLSPIIFFVLIFELYRRLEVARNSLGRAREPWVFLNINNAFDFLICLLFCITPTVSFIVINFLYADVQDLFLNVFGYQISPRAILTLNFEKTPGRGWWDIDHWSFFILFAFGVSVYYVFLVQRCLIEILVKENRHIVRRYSKR